MKTISQYILLTSLALCTFSCNQGNKTEQIVEQSAQTSDPVSDSLAIMKIFGQISRSDDFRKDLALDDDPDAKINTDQSTLIRGDLNGDGTSDALLSFSIENRGGGNNADFHYAIFLQKEGQWLYDGEIDTGGDAMDYFTDLTSIKDGWVYGTAQPMQDASLKPYTLVYQYKDKDLINTYSALHRGEETENEYLEILGFQNEDLDFIPVQTTLKELQKFFGKGKVTIPTPELECGTFFEDSPIRYYENGFIIYELSTDNEAAFSELTLKNSGLTILTDKGTLNTETTLDEVKSAFYHSKSWEINKKEASVPLFAGEESDDLIVLYFNPQGRLERIGWYIQC